MCAILDASCFNGFFSGSEDFAPVHKWIEEKNGKLVYSPTEKFEKEWDGEEKRRYIKDRIGSGKIKQIDEKVVHIKTQKWKAAQIQSDDPHIIALAEVSGAKVLFTNDTDLEKDFKKFIKGSIYKNKNHAHLLKPDTCP